jgi:hypothetical protein
VKDSETVGESRGNIIGAIRKALTSSLKNTGYITSKNKPVSLMMHLKIPLAIRGLKLSNSKPGCRVSALHHFVKQIPTMAF